MKPQKDILQRNAVILSDASNVSNWNLDLNKTLTFIFIFDTFFGESVYYALISFFFFFTCFLSTAPQLHHMMAGKLAK